MLGEDHVKPLMRLIKLIRQRHGCRSVPNVDPEDGGIHAAALFLLESPGPKAVGTYFVSRDNPDPSARNMGCALCQAGFSRKQTLLWNTVPQCISTPTENRNATRLQVLGALPYTLAFIAEMVAPKVIVLCGRRAQWQQGALAREIQIPVLSTYHPAARSWNYEPYREDILWTFRKARALIDA